MSMFLTDRDGQRHEVPRAVEAEGAAAVGAWADTQGIDTTPAPDAPPPEAATPTKTGRRARRTPGGEG